MPHIQVFHVYGAPQDLGTVAPGVTASGRETNVYDVDVRGLWEEPDITSLLNTMAKIADKLTPGTNFTVNLQTTDAGTVVTLYLGSTPDGPRLYSELLHIPPLVVAAWRKKNLQPLTPGTQH